MAELLTQLAATGALPPEFAGRLGEMREYFNAAAAEGVGGGGAGGPGGGGSGPGGPGAVSVGGFRPARSKIGGQGTGPSGMFAQSDFNAGAAGAQSGVGLGRVSTARLLL